MFSQACWAPTPPLQDQAPPAVSYPAWAPRRGREVVPVLLCPGPGIRHFAQGMGAPGGKAVSVLEERTPRTLPGARLPRPVPAILGNIPLSPEQCLPRGIEPFLPQPGSPLWPPRTCTPPATGKSLPYQATIPSPQPGLKMTPKPSFFLEPRPSCSTACVCVSLCLGMDLSVGSAL